MRRAWLLLLFGCGVSFPSESKVEDLRILELRVSPPEIRVFEEVDVDAEPEDLVTLAPNDEPVRVTALLAHPDLDATFEVSWNRCVGADGTGFFRIPCGGEFKERLGTSTSTVVRPIQILLEDLAMQAGAPEEGLATLIGDPRDLFSGIRLFINAQASVASASIEVDTTRLEGTKRLLVFDPTLVALVLREARRQGPGAIPMIEGVEVPTLCTNVSEQEFGSVLDYLATREANRAPEYLSVEVRLPSATATVTWSPGDPPIEVGPNDPIMIRGRVAESAKEIYRVIDFKCRLTEFTETMTWSWFTNVGELSDGLTSEGITPLEDELTTTWRAPPADELEEDRTRVRIWSVLRDGRGGSDSRSIDLVISKDG